MEPIRQLAYWMEQETIKGFRIEGEFLVVSFTGEVEVKLNKTHESTDCHRLKRKQAA